MGDKTKIRLGITPTGEVDAWADEAGASLTEAAGGGGDPLSATRTSIATGAPSSCSATSRSSSAKFASIHLATNGLSVARRMRLPLTSMVV